MFFTLKKEGFLFFYKKKINHLNIRLNTILNYLKKKKFLTNFNFKLSN